MGALWRRRTIRHLLVGLLPLLVVGTALAAVLAVRFAEAAAPVREATGRAVATVERSGAGSDGREVVLGWTDERGTRRTSTVRAAEAGAVPAGRQVELRYRPGDPTRVFVAGDETSTRLRDLAYGLALTVLVTVTALLVTAVHVARRVAAERRPGRSMPVGYARSRRGLLQRAWLTVSDEGREWWVPVHWDPLLPDLRPGTAATVHGRPARDRVVVVDLGGTAVWQAGRRRAGPPGGEVTRIGGTAAASRRENTARSRTARPLGLGRQLRFDSALLIAAPVVGLLWAYLDESGPRSWAAASALAVGVLFWLPTLTGSDPTPAGTEADR